MTRAVPPEVIRQVKGAQGTTQDRARRFGLSISIVHKIRQGRYDERIRPDFKPPTPAMVLPQWCDRCKCHVIGDCAKCAMDGALSTDPRRAAIDPATVRDERLRRRLALPISTIGLNARTSNTLEKYGYWTVGHLLAAKRSDLRAHQNIGPSMVRHILDVLARLGFR